MCWCEVILYVCLWCVCWSSAQDCSFPQLESLNFTITSQYNQTGHWIGQITMNHGEKEAGREIWKLDVGHITSRCDGEKYVSVVATITAPPQVNNNPGFKVYKKLDPSYHIVPGLGYYKTHTNERTWHAAKEICSAEGAHLLILNSDAEWKAINKLWEKTISSVSFVPVGISDYVNEGQFVTIFGEPMNETGYYKWDTSQPNGGITDNCVYLRKNSLLHDWDCDKIFPFFCEREL